MSGRKEGGKKICVKTKTDKKVQKKNLTIYKEKGKLDKKERNRRSVAE
jgi:hypothetical protein